MAGNKAIFDAAMKRGQGYAFDNQWDRALREYQRALAEFPTDHEARTAQAQALFRAGQWEQAALEYQKLLAEQPNDPFIINRIAECFMKLGRTTEAETALSQLAKIYDDQSMPREAIQALRTMVQLNPRRPETHQRLAALYRHMGDRNAAVGEYLILSRMALEQQPSDLDTAVHQAETAFALDKEHRAAREWLSRLRQRQAEVAGVQFDERTLEVVGAGPVGGVVSPREVNEMLALAESYRDRGQNAAAMRQYEAVIKAGLRRADVYYNLGLLYQQLGQYDQALVVLRLAGDDAEYAMSSYYALGMCFAQMGRLHEATQAFENAVASVDLQTVTKSEVDDLSELYDAAAKANLNEGNQARAATLYSTLTQFLYARRWHTGRTAEFNRLSEQLTESSVSAKLRRISGEERPRPIAGSSTLRPAQALAPVTSPRLPEGSAGAPQQNANGLSKKPSSDKLRPITDFLRSPVDRSGRQNGNGNGNGGADVLSMPEPWANGPALEPLPDTMPIMRSSLPSNGATPASQPEALSPFPITNGSGQSNGAAHTNGASPLSTVTSTKLVLQETPEENIAKAIADSERYMETGLYDAAVDSCLEVIRLSPDYLPIHMRLAELYSLMGRHDEAVQKLQSIIDVYMVRGEPEMAAQVFPALIELSPDNVNLRSKLATLQLDLGNTDAAVVEYAQLADTYFNAGQHDRALDELRRLRQLAPNNAELRLRAGSYYLRLNRPADALSEFSRAMQLEPNNNLALVRTYIALALNNESAQWDALQTVVERAINGQRDLVLEEIQQAARANKRPELYLALATIYQRLREAAPDNVQADAQLESMTEALERGIVALRGNENTPVALQLRYHRANVALDAGDGASALPLYKDVLEMLDDPELQRQAGAVKGDLLAPEKFDVLQKLADASALNGDVASAIEALQTAKSYAPYDRVIYTKLAELYFRQGRLGAALVALDELIAHYQDTQQTEKMLETLGYMARIAPNNITVRRKLADAYIKRGMIDQGLVELNVLAELQTKNGMLKDAVTTYQRAADIYWTMGQHREAFAVYDKIVRVAPNDIDARQYLINLYIATGRIPEAVREQKQIAATLLRQKNVKEGIAALHQVIALAPSDTEAHYALAQVLAGQHEYDQAARLYNRLRRLEPENEAKLTSLQAEMQRLAAESGRNAVKQ